MVRRRTASGFITAARGGGSKIMKKREERREEKENRGKKGSSLEMAGGCSMGHLEPGVGAISSRNRRRIDGYFLTIWR